jgi:N-acetylglucosaminyl-diphospho-decaprenol L-rhamnosyltransferase
MPTSQTDLTIIIVNYNTPDFVRTALTSIQKFHLSKTKMKTEVIVVDNGSSDHRLRSVAEEFPFLHLIELEKNLGFAGGNNVALKQAQSRYVMLLNSDTEFTATTDLDLLVEYADRHSEVGVITPRVELSTGGIDWASHRGEPTPWASFTYFGKLEKVFPHFPLFASYHQKYKNLDQIHTIDACSGAAMIVRSSAIEKVGYLDELFFMYAEDLDWCKRFRDAGYQIVYNPGCVIIHHKYKSGLQNQNKNVAKKTSQYFYDTMLQYYDKHYKNRYPGFYRLIIKTFIQFKKGAV